MLDMRRLEVLAAAVRERSLAGAAKSLGITPSAASQAISALEAQAGTHLLVRRARGVAPTAAGERLALRAEAMLAQLEAAERELGGPPPGRIRIAAFPTAVYGLLPTALSRFRDEPAQPAVEIIELEPDDARAALRATQVDLALVNHDAALAPDARGPFRVHHIVDEPVYAALPANHRRASARRLDLTTLTHDPWVMQTAASPCQQLTMRACAEAGFAPSVAATCGDYRSILALVATGCGVALIPSLATHGLNTDDVALKNTRPVIARRINALVPDGRTEPSVALLLRILRAVAAE
jgi:DNA-binding transcriptional LysR family regulator